MPLNRSDVIGKIAERAGLTRNQADSALAAFQEVLVTALSAGQAVKLSGLLNVERIERAARTGRNPRTGEPLAIPAGYGVKLTAGNVLKGAVRR
jgi:DNA-binding protein HU-beta